MEINNGSKLTYAYRLAVGPVRQRPNFLHIEQNLPHFVLCSTQNALMHNQLQSYFKLNSAFPHRLIFCQYYDKLKTNFLEVLSNSNKVGRHSWSKTRFFFFSCAQISFLHSLG